MLNQSISHPLCLLHTCVYVCVPSVRSACVRACVLQVRVAKNTLLRVAIEGDDKWSVVSPQLAQSNMWFFIGSDLKVCVFV